MKGSPMTQGDVNTHFEKISDKAKTATDHLKAAGQKTRDQLEGEVKSARDKATSSTQR
jgi:uncharacterized protein YjbJ (UPF0337 family)